MSRNALHGTAVDSHRFATADTRQSEVGRDKGDARRDHQHRLKVYQISLGVIVSGAARSTASGNWRNHSPGPSPARPALPAGKDTST